VEHHLLQCQNLQRKKEKNNLEFTLECRQPQCGIYLLLRLLSSTICRFGECQPPETARIVG
jgi:hypothetical protein